MKKIAGLFTVLLLLSATAFKTYAQVSIGVSVNVAPPVLPAYSQPPCPVDGYLWTPGYWAYDQDGGYYWVPGVWVSPPSPGYLWTPGYWGYDGAVYIYHEGYWGRHIGFYGGVNYGYGYIGTGYVGGRWAGNSFQYNTAVVNVNTTIVHNTYINKTVVNNVTVNNNSFNGPGGVTSRPGQQDRLAERDAHLQPTSDQVSHRQVAVNDRSQFAKVNNGQPATTAMNRVNGNHFASDGNNARPSSTLNGNGNAGSHRAPANGTSVNPPASNQSKPVNQQHIRAPRRQPPVPREARPRRERQ